MLPGSSVDGLEKIELLCTGTPAKPRAFKKKSALELGFHFVANEKAWTIAERF